MPQAHLHMEFRFHDIREANWPTPASDIRPRAQIVLCLWRAR